jgi:hypothetical protein
MNSLKKILFIASLLHSVFASGQEKKELHQFSGRLLNETLQPLQFAHILILNSMRGNITDVDGMFSIVVEPNDTIMMTCIGYKKQIIIIPDTLSADFITQDYILETDTVAINEVVVYPWKTYEEFKQAFLNVKIPENDAERARKNIALLKTQIILDDTPLPNQNFRQVMQQQYEQTFIEGTAPSITVTNPFAWARFFEALKRGDFEYDDNLKEKNRNYNRRNRQ